MSELSRHATFHSLGLLALLLVTTACSSGAGGPTEPPTPELSMVGSSVSVDGDPIGDGETYHHGRHGGGESTRFEASLRFNGGPAPGETVQVRFERPMGMMHGNGTFRLYDDGTHGDPVAGDGEYCLEDHRGRYGFHHGGAQHGQYHYEFWGTHHGGYETARHRVTITVAE